LPFFEPYKIPGVWLWAAIELVIPAASFWWMSSLSAKPAIDLNLFKRRDLPNILTKFQFGEEFLSRYFSRRAIQASSDRSLRSIKATNAVV